MTRSNGLNLSSKLGECVKCKGSSITYIYTLIIAQQFVNSKYAGFLRFFPKFSRNYSKHGLGCLLG